ncbi:hypothetical protein OG568_01115 [Streptomyces sp. NBC_01450]|uniref:hypothetical protein n=1 Tax=Streptomyces sp. NBC_01450 TaxID=2903871 RepID=UPI002E31E46A|nr:hypothetical protein [Streptomyces sp. NBC_01450]
MLVAVAVAVPAGEAQDPVLHPGYGFPRSCAALRGFPLPHPAGGHPAAPPA